MSRRLGCCREQLRRCGVILFELLLQAAETLRRHDLLTAVASSRDIATSNL